MRSTAVCVRPLSSTPSVDELYVAVFSALELLEARKRAEARGQWADRYRYEIGEFLEIAKAITTERDINKLLALILEKTRFITGADAGSIYVVEGDDPDIERRTLHFKLTQNDSVTFDASEFVMAINERSMARLRGAQPHVAQHCRRVRPAARVAVRL